MGKLWDNSVRSQTVYRGLLSLILRLIFMVSVEQIKHGKRESYSKRN
jgi:hypothetical protein